MISVSYFNSLWPPGDWPRDDAEYLFARHISAEPFSLVNIDEALVSDTGPVYVYGGCSFFNQVRKPTPRRENFLFFEFGFLPETVTAPDPFGIYYNPLSDSLLEESLKAATADERSAAVLRKAGRDYRRRIRKARVTKYYKGSVLTPTESMRQIDRFSDPVLVLDQLALDCSLLSTRSSRVDTTDRQVSLQFLKAVMEDFPGRNIIYKTHPATIGFGNELLAVKDPRVLITTEENDEIHWYLERCPDVCVMCTQVGGFEALAYDNTIHAYCPSFYSHYGLTRDLEELGRARPVVDRDLFIGVVIEQFLLPPLGVSPSDHFDAVERSFKYHHSRKRQREARR